MIDYSKLREKFCEIYGIALPRIFRAPGRVNLIGEHTDYNGGFVLPIAIDKETAVAISARNDRKIRCFTVNLGEMAELDLGETSDHKSGYWMNYVEGVARILEENGARSPGANILIWSDVPTGAGLSSSAALEVAIGLALSETTGQRMDRRILAKIGQRTEHDYAGAKTGIMDQFVSAHARRGDALLLDCRSLKHEHLPLDTSDVAVVMCDTSIKHELASTEYNVRRLECEGALEILKNFLPGIEQLRDVDAAGLERYKCELPELVRRRARHVVSENERTLRAARALKSNDLTTFGGLMNLSHASLAGDYEVSCRELDILVELAAELPGVLGARMTGGGFGGSTVNLVERKHLDQFMMVISARYQEMTGIELKIIVSEPSEGASEILD